MEIKKVNRKRIYEDISEQLEEMLLNSDLQPGDKFYSEKELSQMFDVSRTTIRQALTVLEIKGLIERRKGAATYLSSNSNGTVSADNTQKTNSSNDFLITNMLQVLSEIPKNVLSEPLEVRRIIEPSLAKLAAKRADENDLQQIKECLDLQKIAIEKGNITTDEDSKFHFAIAKAAKNGMLLVLIETSHELLYESRYKSHLAEESGIDSYRDHVSIYNAIKAKDANTAYEAMFEHLLRVENKILIFTKNSGENNT